MLIKPQTVTKPEEGWRATRRVSQRVALLPTKSVARTGLGRALVRARLRTTAKSLAGLCSFTPAVVRGQNQIARAATLRNVESFCGCKFGVGRAKGGRRFAQTLTEAAVRTDVDRRGFEVAFFGETCGPVNVVGNSDRAARRANWLPRGSMPLRATRSDGADHLVAALKAGLRSLLAWARSSVCWARPFPGNRECDLRDGSSHNHGSAGGDVVRFAR